MITQVGVDPDGWPIIANLVDGRLVDGMQALQAQSDRILRNARRRLAPVIQGRDSDGWPVEVDRY